MIDLLSQELLPGEGATTATHRWTNRGAGKPAATPMITTPSKLIPFLYDFPTSLIPTVSSILQAKYYWNS